MQPGNPGQDPYGQQPNQDPTAPPQYSDPYAQPPQAPYGQQPHDPYGQPPTSGQPYGQPYPDPYAQQQSPQPYGAAPGYPAGAYGQYGAPPQNNNLGLIGMIAGIASIVFGICCPLIGVPAGIAGVVLGVMGQKKVDQGLAANPGQAKAGLITGAIGIVLGLINAVAGVALNLGDLNLGT